jgi:hypothetical protein
MNWVRRVREGFIDQPGAFPMLRQQEREGLGAKRGRIYESQAIVVPLIPHPEPKNAVLSRIDARQTGSPGRATVGKWSRFQDGRRSLLVQSLKIGESSSVNQRIQEIECCPI